MASRQAVISREEFWEPLIQYLLEVFKVGMKLLLHLGDLVSWLCSDKQQRPVRGRSRYVSTWGCKDQCPCSSWEGASGANSSAGGRIIAE